MAVLHKGSPRDHVHQDHLVKLVKLMLWATASTYVSRISEVEPQAPQVVPQTRV